MDIVEHIEDDSDAGTEKSVNGIIASIRMIFSLGSKFRSRQTGKMNTGAVYMAAKRPVWNLTVWDPRPFSISMFWLAVLLVMCAIAGF